jgi:hypothetical protein
MVQKSKGGKKSRSVKKGRIAKSQIKYNRKTNYRKRDPPETKERKTRVVDCSICYEPTTDALENTTTCGKTKHAICLACKKRIKGNTCPMCRSHKMYLPRVIPEPDYLAIYSKGSRLGTGDIASDEKVLFWRYNDDSRSLYPHHVGWG